MRELWNCYWGCQEGEYHRSKKLNCQDRMGYKEDGCRQSIAMVDGTGQTNWNPVAGEKIADTVAEFLMDYFDDIVGEWSNWVGKILMKKIYDVILTMMEAYKQPAKEFNFTLMGACIDHKSGTYCTIHLGDGAIVSGGEAPYIVSYPFNGKNEQETCLVLSDRVLQHMKFKSGEVGAMQYLALCTDGVYEQRDKIRGVFEKIKDFRLKNQMQPGRDDMGIIMLEAR